MVKPKLFHAERDSIMLDSKSFNKMLGAHFRDIRVEERMTQENLADQTGLSRATIASLESGRQAMTIYHLTKMITGLRLENFDGLYELCRTGAVATSVGVVDHVKLTKDQEKLMQALMSKFDGSSNEDD